MLPPAQCGPWCIALCVRFGGTKEKNAHALLLLSQDTFLAVPAETVVLESGTPTQVGARRVITMGPGAAVYETLTSHCPNGPVYSLSYEFNRPALGASHYSAVWVVHPVSAAVSTLTCSCGWQCADAAAGEGVRTALVGIFNSLFVAVDARVTAHQ